MTEGTDSAFGRSVALGVLFLALLASILAGRAAGAPGDVTTALLTNVNPAAGSSSPADFTSVNGTVYFSASDGTNGNELWKTDGTAAGTAMVDDDMVANGGINPGSLNASPAELTNVNGVLYFSATGPSGTELYRSDGTPAGTVMVEDALPGGGINPSGNSNPEELTNVGGILYFAATDPINGREVWRTDGTPAGTFVVDDDDPADGGINGGAGSEDSDATPAFLTNVNGTLYFQADDGTNGFELWKTDGTAAGTAMVEDAVAGNGINPTGSSDPAELANVNGTLFFQAREETNGIELWKVTGPITAALVKDIDPGGGPLNANSSVPQPLVNVGGTLYFAADEPTNGRELWKSNGTDAGTVMVDDDDPANGGIGFGVADGAEPMPEIAALNGIAYFTATDGTNGFELWRTDGTAAGTAMIEDPVPGGGINPGSGSSSPYGLTGLNGIPYFAAYDGGWELWRGDGTFAGAVLVEDSVPGGGINPSAGSNPDYLTNINGALYFSANDGTNGAEPWTATVEGPAPSVNPTTPAPAKKKCKKKKGKKGAAAAKKCKKKKRKK